jgi:hypothetical protein
MRFSSSKSLDLPVECGDQLSCLSMTLITSVSDLLHGDLKKAWTRVTFDSIDTGFRRLWICVLVFAAQVHDWKNVESNGSRRRQE